jgi:hypothetical protein
VAILTTLGFTGVSALAVPRWQSAQPWVSEFASSASFFRVFLSLCFPCADNATVAPRCNSLEIQTSRSKSIIEPKLE